MNQTNGIITFNALEKERVRPSIERTGERMGKSAGSIIVLLSRLADRLFTLRNGAILKKWLVWLAILVFLAEVTVTFFQQPLFGLTGAVPGEALTKFLSAFYHPLTVILVYEVLLLILSFEESIVDFLQKQFEIVSLVILRDVFKHVAELPAAFAAGTFASPAVRDVAWGMLGSLSIYFLVEVFQRMERRYATDELEKEPAGLKRTKRGLSVILSLVFLGVIAYQGVQWLADPVTATFQASYFQQVFTVLVVADIFLLLLALLYLQSYSLIFEYSAFVLSSVLLLIGLALSTPYQVILSLVALLFSQSVLVLHWYTRSDYGS